MQNIMEPNSQEILDIVSKTGCLTLSQVKHIDLSKNAETTMKFLQRYNYIKVIGDNYLIPFFQKTEKESAVACMWVLLNLITNAETGEIDHDKLATLVEGNGVIDFSYIHDNTKVINFSYLDDGYFSKVNAIKQRFYNFTGVDKGDEKSSGIIHMLVTTSPEVFVKVSEMDMPMPHRLVLIEGDLAGEPTLKFA